MNPSEGAKGAATVGIGGLAGDALEGNGLDIASQAVGDAVATAQSVLADLGLSLPFTVVLDAGVVPA